MKLKSILIAAAVASPLFVFSIAFAADAASSPAPAKPNASAAAAHTAAKKKLAQCKADAAAQKPALDAQATKLFLHTCVTKAE
jgi:type IV secretory pathway VirB6-like protein